MLDCGVISNDTFNDTFVLPLIPVYPANYLLLSQTAVHEWAQKTDFCFRDA